MVKDIQELAQGLNKHFDILERLEEIFLSHIPPDS